MVSQSSWNIDCYLVWRRLVLALGWSRYWVEIQSELENWSVKMGLYKSDGLTIKLKYGVRPESWSVNLSAVFICFIMSAKWNRRQTCELQLLFLCFWIWRISEYTVRFSWTLLTILVPLQHSHSVFSCKYIQL